MKPISKKAHDALTHYGWVTTDGAVYTNPALRGHQVFLFRSDAPWAPVLWEHHGHNSVHKGFGCEQLEYHLMRADPIYPHRCQPHSEKWQAYLLEHGAREAIIEWLCWNDHNGCFRDKDALAECGSILSLEEARKIMRDMLERDKEDGMIAICEVCNAPLTDDDLHDGVTVSADCCQRVGLCAECRKEGNHDCDE